MMVDARLTLFLTLATMHTTLLIVSNVSGTKLIEMPFALGASATVVSYILTYVLINVIADLFGKAVSSLVIVLGLVGLAISVVFVELAIWLPPAPGWSGQEQFARVLGASWRLALGGWTAYLCSQFVDVWIFVALKGTALGRRFVGLAAWITMLAAQLLDTVIFVVVAFYGSSSLLSILTGQYLAKTLFMTIATPAVPLVISSSRKWLSAKSSPASRKAGSGSAIE
jgi:uncharacterized integral membrane protein (TIGR00697 family)